MSQVGTELWERLGNIGWSVSELVHDNERHPCELIEQIAGADVLLTSHGFQVKGVFSALECVFALSNR